MISREIDGDYAIIRREVLEDRELSWEAKGLWSYLFTRNNYLIHHEDVEKLFKEINSLNSPTALIFRELIEAGYVEEITLTFGKIDEKRYIIKPHRKKSKLKKIEKQNKG